MLHPGEGSKQLHLQFPIDRVDLDDVMLVVVPLNVLAILLLGSCQEMRWSYGKPFWHSHCGVRQLQLQNWSQDLLKMYYIVQKYSTFI